MVSS
jgi:hypothetical protein